jgi:hypothetical protein
MIESRPWGGRRAFLPAAMASALLALALTGCIAMPPVVAAQFEPAAPLAPQDLRTFQVSGARSTEAAPYGPALRSGQLVASDAGAPVSLLLSLIGEEYSPYVHAGILVIEAGVPYVYETFGILRPFHRGPPTDAMGGKVRRVSLQRYIARQRITAIFDPPGVTDAGAVVRFVQERHRDGTRFDPYFDWFDHERLYCTEFAALALHAGGAPLPAPVRVRDNASLRILLEWLNVEAQHIVTVSSLLGDAAPVVLVSRRHDADGIKDYFAAKRELHERFTAGQTLGSLWSWSWRGLRLRPEVAAFLKAPGKGASGASQP